MIGFVITLIFLGLALIPLYFAVKNADNHPTFFTLILVAIGIAVIGFYLSFLGF